MNRYQRHIAKLSEENNLRILRDTEPMGSNILYNGVVLRNFSSNDYMGIGANEQLWREFLSSDNLSANGGSCSSRLLTGNSPVHNDLERRLGDLYGREALLFNSGYHANIGILPALAERGDLILADKLVHASLIDGLRLSNAEVVRFRHNDMEQLTDILQKRREQYESVFIVTESVFSMDGDLCPLRELVEIKTKYKALLYLDEAHSVGVRGNRGLGLAEQMDVTDNIDLLVGTMGKAFASSGAYLICSNTIKSLLINTSRSLIYSTSLPSINVAWSSFVLDRLVGMDSQREHLKTISDRLRRALVSLNLETMGESNVVPIILRDNSLAEEFSQRAIEGGFFLLPIRTPTVPAGSQRVRISLSAAHSVEDIDNFIEICRAFGK